MQISLKEVWIIYKRNCRTVTSSFSRPARSFARKIKIIINILLSPEATPEAQNPWWHGGIAIRKVFARKP